MNVRRSFDQRLDAWLDEGPQTAPAGLVSSVLQEFPRIHQRGGALPRLIRGRPMLGVGIAAALAIAIGGLVLTQLPSRGPGGPPPTLTPTPSPLPSGVALLFDRPFGYSLDPALGLALKDGATRDIYEFWVPGQRGVALRIVDEVRLDTCSPEGGSLRPVADPQELVDYLSAVRGLDVTTPVETVVDARPGLSVDVVTNPDVDCPSIYIWPDGSAFTDVLPSGSTRRMTAIEVDGAIVLIIVWALPDLDPWLPDADRFIETIDFLEPEPSPPSGSPIASPGG